MGYPCIGAVTAVASGTSAFSIISPNIPGCEIGDYAIVCLWLYDNAADPSGGDYSFNWSEPPTLSLANNADGDFGSATGISNADGSQWHAFYFQGFDVDAAGGLTVEFDDISVSSLFGPPGDLVNAYLSVAVYRGFEWTQHALSDESTWDEADQTVTIAGYEDVDIAIAVVSPGASVPGGFTSRSPQVGDEEPSVGTYTISDSTGVDLLVVGYEESPPPPSSSGNFWDGQIAQSMPNSFA